MSFDRSWSTTRAIAFVGASSESMSSSSRTKKAAYKKTDTLGTPLC